MWYFRPCAGRRTAAPSVCLFLGWHPFLQDFDCHDQLVGCYLFFLVRHHSIQESRDTWADRSQTVAAVPAGRPPPAVPCGHLILLLLLLLLTLFFLSFCLIGPPRLLCPSYTFFSFSVGAAHQRRGNRLLLDMRNRTSWSCTPFVCCFSKCEPVSGHVHQ